MSAMTWTEEVVHTWLPDGSRAERVVRASGRWRLRVASDRRLRATGVLDQTDHARDFAVLFDRDFDLWIRARGTRAFGTDAHAGGISVEIGQDLTRGLAHEVRLQPKPSDESRVRWSCSCGVRSRGDAPLDQARAAADDHRSQLRPQPTGARVDVAVAQDASGTWSRQEVHVLKSARVCVRSDLSTVRAHQTGYGEEFEVAVDSRLGLWVRTLGSEAALRRDEDARGVSLVILRYDD